MAGSEEFLADRHEYAFSRNGNLPSAEEARTASAVYSLMQIDAGFLSKRSAEWLQKATGSLPPGFHIVEEKPVTCMLPTPAGNVGVVFFPDAPEGPSRRQQQDVLAAGRALLEKAVLVMGVSPWGYVEEKNFLPKAEGVFHCLFGGGDGFPFAFHISPKNPSILWLRSDTQGRSVTEFTLLDLPRSDEGKKPRWAEGITFRAAMVALRDSFVPDPAVQQLLNKDEEEER